eukprot:TRINITY_DN505_c0_g1_i2.p1 TRINITY_DN505_c0_g1~~TRINITY_DN505_c0_g1_i2.p1  ORF type:complete len:124 (-),score=14.84 TRINITY_DN505_c0_g1_i2:67-438(-)
MRVVLSDWRNKVLGRVELGNFTRRGLAKNDKITRNSLFEQMNSTLPQSQEAFVEQPGPKVRFGLGGFPFSLCSSETIHFRWPLFVFQVARELISPRKGPDILLGTWVETTGLLKIEFPSPPNS